MATLRMRVGRGAAGLALALSAVIVGGTAAQATPPVYPFPTLTLQRTIYTSPFANSPSVHPGDIEGLAHDPVRNTLWASDDSKFRLYEIDYTTGFLLNIVTRSQLANTLQYQPGGPPAGAPAGIDRAYDLEAMAYDAATDTLYAFAGHCCSAIHHGTVWRLKRPGAGQPFAPESYQPLDAMSTPGFPDDYSGVGVIGGQIYLGNTKTLYRYDYAANGILGTVGPLAISGSITGLSDSAAVTPATDEIWVTTSATIPRLYRFTWGPPPVLVPNHMFMLPSLGIGDSRAVEVVGDSLVVVDGYDFYPAGTPTEFSIRIFDVEQRPPTASFDLAPTQGGIPLPVTFTDTSTDRPTSWQWNFGDGSPVSSAQSPSHTYTAAGSYTVTLTATNPNGSSTATHTVTATSLLPASFTMSPVTPIAPAVSQLVTFTDTTVVSPAVTSWQWDFGDGATATTATATHVYTAPGTYNVTLTVANAVDSGTTTKALTVFAGPTPSFTVDAASGTAPHSVSFADTSTANPPVNSWSWNFGDGSPLETAADPTHIYTSPGNFTVTMTVSNGVGAPVSTTRNIQVVSGAHAEFSPIAAAGAAPLTVTFTDQSTGTPLPISWTWEFGDGTTSLVQNPTHVFTTPGYYTVKLTAANSVGPDTITHSVVVTAPPAAVFSASPATGLAPLSVTLTDAFTGVPAPTDWTWDFGDGSPVSHDRNPSHVYAAPGQYTVSLTVDSPIGTSTTTRSVLATSAPAATFTATPSTGLAPLAVTFTDQSTAVPVPSSWRWDFGDGSPVTTGPTAAHTYTAPGTYTAKLTVSNSAGTTSTTRSIVVEASPGYVGVQPARLLDTRNAPTVDGRFSSLGRRGTATLELPVAGRGGVPPTGVRAVVVNVTAVTPSAESYLTVWPSGSLQPTASNLNYVADQTFPNLVVVPLGTNGQISLANAAGTTDLIVDVLGYFPAASSFTAVGPARITDTRAGGSTIDGIERAAGPLGAGGIRLVTVTGRAGVPAGGRGSVILNVTAVGAASASYLTVWPSGEPRPTASNLNMSAGQTIPNLVVVPVGADGRVAVFNEAGRVDVLVDVLGWMPAGPLFSGLTPARLLDTRPGGSTVDGLGLGEGTFGPGAARRLQILGRGGVPAAGVGSVALNVTVTGPTADSYLTVWPSQATQPTASNLNWVAGDTFPNMVIVPVGPDGKVSIYNEAGRADVIVDVLGWFS